MKPATTLRYGSVCSGIEAVTCGWHGLGFEAQWFSEIAAFPSSVLAHRWPSVPNLGDFTKIATHWRRDPHGAVDLLVGGTPCQSFSESGQRDGLDDPRGHLTLEFLSLARRLGARWVVWENVPGILHHEGGATFETVLRLLGECGYGWAYRVLDAQYFGVPQRRRRVFVVGYLGDWRPPAAVLLDRPSMHRDPRARSKAGTSVARAPGAGSHGDGDVAHTLRTAGRSADLHQTIAATIAGHHGRNSPEDNYVTHALTTSQGRQGRLGGSSDQTYVTAPEDHGHDEDHGDHGDRAARCLTARKGRDGASSDQTFALGFHCTQDPISVQDGTPALTREHSGPLAVLPIQETGRSRAAVQNGMGVGEDGDPMYTLTTNHKHGVFAYDEVQITSPDNRSVVDPEAPAPTLSKQSRLSVADSGQLLRPRRLTPRECKRLMGFADDYTLVPGSSDSSRYEALGNSIAVPVLVWIGKRIVTVEKILKGLASGK